MARRSLKCIVDSPAGRHEMPAAEWWRLVRAGLLRIVKDRIATPAKNVIAWLENGKLRLVHAYWVYTSWIAIERWAPVRGREASDILRRQYATKAYWTAAIAFGKEEESFVDGWA